MECKEVQGELARETTAGLSDAVNAHIARCVVCRRTRFLYSRIEEVLREKQLWHPPLQFAERIGMQAVRSRAGLLTRSFVFAILLGVFVAITLMTAFPPRAAALALVGAALDGYVALLTIVSTLLVSYAFTVVMLATVLSIAASAWLVRRTLA
jgi:hypothetical protein